MRYVEKHGKTWGLLLISNSKQAAHGDRTSSPLSLMTPVTSFFRRRLPFRHGGNP